MNKIPNDQYPFRTAAETVASRALLQPSSDRSAEELLYELQVHQIELEMQNEMLRETQSKLEVSRDRYVDLYDFAPVGYMTLTEAGLISEVNLTGATLLGTDRIKLLQCHFARFVSPDDSDRWHLCLSRVLNMGEKQHCELLLSRANGTTFYAEVAGLKIISSNGEHSVRIAFTDISERKRSEQERVDRGIELQRLERMFRSLADNLPDNVSRFDSQLRRIYANPQLERSLGMPMESLLGKRVPEQLKHIWEPVLMRVFSTGQTEVFEFELPAVGGGINYYQGIAVAEYDASAEVETVLTISRNISTLKNNEMKLRESEERLHTIASNVPGMVIQCCRGTDENRLKFTYVSDGAKDLLSLDAETVLQNSSEFTGRIIGEHVKTFYDSMAQSQCKMKLWNWEGSITSADGSLKWINLRATPHLQGGDKCIWEGVVINITESKANENKLVDSQRILRELSTHLDNVREDELKRVAREIHDEMGQTLTALKMDVSLARINFGKFNPQLMDRLQSMTQLVDRTIMIARHITSSLRPGALDLGIVAAIEWLVDEFTGYTGIACELVLGDGDKTLNESSAIAVFRIVQESLTNIARHAEATKVEIIVRGTPDYFWLEVCDNGKGFDLRAPARRDSFGLVGMRERMAMLQGELKLDSEPGQGTRVCVRVPLNP